MRRVFLFFFPVVVASLLGAPVARAQQAEAAKKPETLEERFGYAYGLQVAQQLKGSGVPLDVEQFAQALRDQAEGREAAMSDAEMKQTFLEVQQSAEKVRAEAGRKFLEENGKKDGVKTTASGLQYQVLKEGKGARPKATDTVSMHYCGTLIDGTEFDSSYQGNAPPRVPLNRVLPAWTEGLQLMKEGAKYRFFVPYDLGYGAEGSPPDVPPYSTLIFELELLDIGK